MAVKRYRKYGKKRRGATRRVSRRTSRKMTLYRQPRNVHSFIRYSYLQGGGTNNVFQMNSSGQFFGSIYSNGISSIGYGVASTLLMPNVTEFTNLFDQYKVLSYTVEFLPRFTDQQLTGSGAAAIPVIYWYYDTDDNTTPSTVTEIMQHPKIRRARLSKPVSITVKYPCVAQMLYNGVASTAYGARRSPWIDIVNYEVPHYGAKYIIQGAPSLDYTGTIDVRVKWRFLCKNPR